jgi:hypothetical protein
MLFAVAVEFVHFGLALLIVRPFPEILHALLPHFPGMVIAVSLGVGISIIIIHHTKE